MGTRSARVFAFCAAGPLASPRPEVCVRIWRMVRLAGFPDGVFKFANSGRYFATGSETLSLPASFNIGSGVAVIGFVIDAIQKRLSIDIGFFAATSAEPVASM